MPHTDETAFSGSLADVVRAFPQAIALFEAAGIDYSCGGARSFEEAERAAGFEPGELRKLVEASPRPDEVIDWGLQPVGKLTKYLSESHAELAGRLLPAVRECVAKSTGLWPAVKEIRRVGALLERLEAGIAPHIARETLELFPRIEGRGQNVAAVDDVRLSPMILRTLVEHEAFNEQLRTMRELCQRIPEGVAGELVEAIEELGRFVHFHLHLENNLLYPRAVERENRRRQRGQTGEQTH